MFKGLFKSQLNYLLAGLLTVALSLLAYAHETPVRTGPIVLAPDGTVAVLCLAVPQDDAPVHFAEECTACRIVHAIDCPDIAGPVGTVAWHRVERRITTPIIGHDIARIFDAAPRAPPA
ncbi:hypothetical protein SAMN06273572_101821 [Monaibacterium marinum]|uniref:Uncharacterized protein n=2 Tax=Pontivivens marinum TaxID=1690039 RepID=A0A2C9CP38_9RHOB|nr:hypothetical protein SAMN06273572_101821 [Monaibacterium marinum]